MSDNLTERQAKWFASVKVSLERDTGRSLEAWAEIVKRDCPETKPGPGPRGLRLNMA